LGVAEKKTMEWERSAERAGDIERNVFEHGAAFCGCIHSVVFVFYFLFVLQLLPSHKLQQFYLHRLFLVPEILLLPAMVQKKTYTSTRNGKN